MPDRQESQLASRLDGIQTRWSLVRIAHDGSSSPIAENARQKLVLRYAKSIRRYIGGIVKSSDDADELAQDAMMRLMKGDFAGADPNRGRFRDFLKTAVRNMIRNHWTKSSRRKTTDIDLDLVAKSDSDDSAWDTEWQTTVLDLAWSRLKDYERENPGQRAYSLLKLRAEHPQASSEELAVLYGKKCKADIRADACRQMLRRARFRFAEALVIEIGIGLADPSPERVAEELADLELLEHVRDFLPDDWVSKGTLVE
jgi:RNA polymerase sigma factor (sigma-70 family)